MALKLFLLTFPLCQITCRASLEFGKGRVVVFGEAAMFSAQVVKEDNGEEWLMGMNAPDAQQNEQFLLNVFTVTSIVNI